MDVVSKGGNFLLNVVPTPQGTFEEEAYQRLAEIGVWMDVNGGGIYSTRPYEVYGEGEELRYTQSKDGRTVFAIALRWPGTELTLRSVSATQGMAVTLLGHEGNLEWSQGTEGLRIELPPGSMGASSHAWVFALSMGSGSTQP